MRIILFIVMVSVLSISCMQSRRSQAGHPSMHSSKKIIAHRGAWKAAGLPENSVAALKEAIRIKCFGSEMDVHMTADSFIVVNHDPDFHKMRIQYSTLADLRRFHLSNGEPLPLLSDFLKVIAQQNQTRLILEIKPSVRGREWAMATVAKVLEEVKRYKAEGHVIYISFDFEMCKELLRLSPGVRVQYLKGDKSPQEVKEAGISGIDYHYSVYQKHPDYFRQARTLEVQTNAWTVNDSLVMDWLLAHDVDYITTNEPSLAMEREKKSFRNAGWKLVWSDEFLKNGLPDSSNWNYNTGGHGWGNAEKQFYTKADTGNAFVSDGLLHIIAKKELKENNHYTSARMVTKGRHSWKYGRVEARAKVPKGVGPWAAFWMLGNNIDEVGWPRCGEIDIMEYVGYMADTILGTVHTEAYNHGKGTQKGGKITIDNPTDDFHVYAIEWDAEKILFFVDDHQYFEFDNEHKTNAEWPFAQPFFIIINLAVGGNLGGAKGIDENAFPATYLIDYIRVWQK